MLNIILKEADPEKALKYVHSVIKDLQNKKTDKEKVIIYTQLQKEISGYDDIGPHVQVAKRMKAKGEKVEPGTMIKYIVAEGKGIIRDRAKIPEELENNEYDSRYYVEHQVIPAVERIFNVLGYKKEDLLEREQNKLDKFF